MRKANEGFSEIAANGVLVLISVACVLLSRQIVVQAEQFQTEGGFTERLYKMRVATRNGQHGLKRYSYPHCLDKNEVTFCPLSGLLITFSSTNVLF